MERLERLLGGPEINPNGEPSSGKSEGWSLWETHALCGAQSRSSSEWSSGPWALASPSSFAWCWDVPTDPRLQQAATPWIFKGIFREVIYLCWNKHKICVVTEAALTWGLRKVPQFLLLLLAGLLSTRDVARPVAMACECKIHTEF